MADTFPSLPTEIIRSILLEGVKDREYGKPFGARCMRLASWVQPWIAPILYHDVDLWTESQAKSFLANIEGTNTYLNVSLKSLIVKSNAFSVHDTQHAYSMIPPRMEASNSSPNGVTSITIMKILSFLQQDCPSWTQLEVSMVILATRRYPSAPIIIMPPSVTLTDVDGIIWSAYTWDNVTHLRFTSYNPTFHESHWFTQLPSLTHFAFAFYYGIHLGIRLVEEMTMSHKMQCVVAVVYPPAPGVQGKVAATAARKALEKLDEPTLVVWEDTPQLIEIFETDDVDVFWAKAEAQAKTQKEQKEAALRLA
ncbi:hypothetical protein CPB86DRAFT_786303 [Serendipita vermifera]|nr:hypothetical protein CPB86DRAFT_786303 [Serendipita vermifera]